MNLNDKLNLMPIRNPNGFDSLRLSLNSVAEARRLQETRQNHGSHYPDHITELQSPILETDAIAGVLVRGTKQIAVPEPLLSHPEPLLSHPEPPTELAIVCKPRWLSRRELETNQVNNCAAQKCQDEARHRRRFFRQRTPAAEC